MSYLKKIGALFVSSALMTSMLAGCGSSYDSTGGNGSQAEGGDGNYNISIVFKTTSNEYTQYMMAGAEKAAAETGAVLDMKGATSETAYDEQQNMIETDLHANKYDAMIIAPLQGDMATTLVSGTDMPISQSIRTLMHRRRFRSSASARRMQRQAAAQRLSRRPRQPAGIRSKQLILRVFRVTPPPMHAAPVSRKALTAQAARSSRTRCSMQTP